MPLTKPSEIFQRKIAAAHEEYLQTPTSERKANGLAIALNDHAEWTFLYHKGKGDSDRLHGAISAMEFREKLFGTCPELRMMWDLADADKHRLLDNPTHSVRASTAAYVIQGDDLIVTAPYNQSFSKAAATAADFWKGWPD